MKGRIDIGLVVMVLLMFLLALAAARGISMGSAKVVVTLMLGVVVCILAFIRPDLALFVLVFSMLLSPEFEIAQIPQRAVVVRIDDVLLIVIFFSWIARLAIHKELGLLRSTPINRPILLFTAICVLFTLRGIMANEIESPLKSFFYLLKYIEFFMLYFLVSNNIRSKRMAKALLLCMLITAAIVSAITYPQIAGGLRTTAPFEGPAAEPATLGGYLLLIFSVSMGLFLYSNSSRQRFWLVLLIGFIISPLIFSLSRASYMAFFPMYFTLLIFSRKKKAFLMVMLVLGIAIGSIGLLPRQVKERVAITFIGDRYKIGGPIPLEVELDTSAGARIESWGDVRDRWIKSPFWGHGVTGIGFFVDGQYILTLGELGIIGLSIFFWLIFLIFVNTLRILRTSADEFSQGLSLGFLAALIGLLTHALTANTFIIVRVMEPFWFLAAMVMTLPILKEEVSSPDLSGQKEEFHEGTDHRN